MTVVHPADAAAGLTQASRVIPVVRSRRLLSATVTQALAPLNERAPPKRPAVVHDAFETAPLSAWPVESDAVVPLVSSKPQAPTRPVVTVALETVTLTAADVVGFPARSRAR